MNKSRNTLIVLVFTALLFFASTAGASQCRMFFDYLPKVHDRVVDLHNTASSTNSLRAVQLAATNTLQNRIRSSGLGHMILNFFAGNFTSQKKAQAKIQEKFGTLDWKSKLKGNVIDLSSIVLTDGELLEMLRYINKDASEVYLAFNTQLTNKSVSRLIEHLNSVQVLDLQGTAVKPNIIDSLIDHQSETLRTLKIDSLRAGDLKKLVGLVDLRYLDMHNSLTIKSKSGVPIWPFNGPIGITELKQFILDSPKNFHTIVIPGHIEGRHYQEIVLAAQSVEMSSRAVQTRMAIKGFKFKSEGALTVLDGDSMAISLSGIPAVLGQNTVRILGVDAGEMSAADGTPEKKMAIAAKEFIETLVANADSMDFTHLAPDKYGGRIVGQVWLRVNKRWLNLSDAIIENGLGIPYFGEAKESVDNPEIWNALYERNKAFVDDLVEKNADN